MTSPSCDGTGASSTHTTAHADASVESAPDANASNANGSNAEEPKTPRGRRRRGLHYLLHPSAVAAMMAAATLTQPASSYCTPSTDSALNFSPLYNAAVTRRCYTYDVTESEWSVFAKRSDDYELFREAVHHQPMTLC